MDEQIREIVRAAILTTINDTASEINIRRSIELHEEKIHFVPAQYRVLGGLLQSLNIRFGNFIEKLIALVVDNDKYVQSMADSGKKVPLQMTPQTDALIDRYITSRQLPDSPDRCDDAFNQLLEQIFTIERSEELPKQVIRKDIDALFRSQTGQIIYLEIKYNDDHDTGKFVDINRKFLKTYAGLINRLNIGSVKELKPILYYFNPTKRWGPIYVPSTNIYRGSQLFEGFFEMSFEDINQYLRILGRDEEIIAIFDRLYDRIRHME